MFKTAAIGLISLLAGAACSPQQIVAHFFPNEIGTADRIVRCESGYVTTAVSPTGDHGLFQINARTWNRPGHSDPVADWIGRHWDGRYDPVINSIMAKKIRDAYGWRMWSCY